jgi:hypothetical protein
MVFRKHLKRVHGVGLSHLRGDVCDILGIADGHDVLLLRGDGQRNDARGAYFVGGIERDGEAGADCTYHTDSECNFAGSQPGVDGNGNDSVDGNSYVPVAMAVLD